MTTRIHSAGRNDAEDIMERLHEYFAAGVKLVWIVYSTDRLIYIYDSPRHVRILGETDELDSGLVLPEFWHGCGFP